MSEKTGKRVTLFCVSLLVGILALGASSQIALGASSQTVDVAEIKLLAWGGPAPMLEEVANLFEAQNPDIKVTIESMPGSSIGPYVASSLMAGETPVDIVYPRLYDAMDWARRGFLLDLTKYVDEIDTSDFFPGILEEAGEYEGKMYGMPMRIAPYTFIYDSDLFSIAGLDPNLAPQNWEELVSYGKKLTDPAQKQYGFAMVAKEPMDTIRQVSTFVMSNGGRLLSEDLSEVIVNEKQTVEAIEFWSDLLLRHGIANPNALEFADEHTYPLFADRKVGMVVAGPWFYDSFGAVAGEGAEERIRAALIPEGPAGIRGGLVSLRSVVIPAGTKFPDQSWRFVKFLTSSDILAQYCRAIPPRKSSSQAERYANPQLKPFVSMLNHNVVFEPAKIPWEETMYVVHSELQNILLGRKSVQNAMDDAVKNANLVLRQEE